MEEKGNGVSNLNSSEIQNQHCGCCRDADGGVLPGRIPSP